MELQHGGDSNTWDSSWKRTGSNETRQDKSSQEIKDTNKNQRSRKLSGICKLLQEVQFRTSVIW